MEFNNNIKKIYKDIVSNEKIWNDTFDKIYKTMNNQKKFTSEENEIIYNKLKERCEDFTNYIYCKKREKYKYKRNFIFLSDWSPKLCLARLKQFAAIFIDRWELEISTECSKLEIPEKNIVILHHSNENKFWYYYDHNGYTNSTLGKNIEENLTTEEVFDEWQKPNNYGIKALIFITRKRIITLPIIDKRVIIVEDYQHITVKHGSVFIKTSKEKDRNYFNLQNANNLPQTKEYPSKHKWIDAVKEGKLFEQEKEFHNL